PGRLGTHAEHAAAARGEDLKIEIVHPHAELLAGGAEGLFDGLSGELAIDTHGQRRLPRRPCRPRWLGRTVAAAEAARSTGVDLGVVARAGAPDSRGGGIGAGRATGKRGLWSTAKPGVRPNRGNIPP